MWIELREIEWRDDKEIYTGCCKRMRKSKHSQKTSSTERFFIQRSSIIKYLFPSLFRYFRISWMLFGDRRIKIQPHNKHTHSHKIPLKLLKEFRLSVSTSFIYSSSKMIGVDYITLCVTVTKSKLRWVRRNEKKKLLNFIYFFLIWLHILALGTNNIALLPSLYTSIPHYIIIPCYSNDLCCCCCCRNYIPQTWVFDV